MRIRLYLSAMLAAAALAAAAPAASADPIIGVGEQDARVFSDPLFQKVGIRHVRLLVGWDALGYAWQRHEIDVWMAEARRTGADVLVTFSRSRNDSRKRWLPSAGEYRKWLRRFRRRYPDVNAFIPWNEANHCSQPTCRRPDMAAKYFDVIKDECRTCIVLAADVLDQPGMVRWVRQFKRHARHHAKRWGLHNYLDANRFRTSGTKALLRITHGEIWFTETGGLVRRRHRSTNHFDESARHAAKATRWVFRLARLSPRIKRVYFYHWLPAGRNALWDSALTSPNGSPRPAYRVLRTWIKAAQARRARRAAPR